MGPVTAPLCAMWQGHCGNPAHLVVTAFAPTGNTWTVLSFPVCNEGVCRQAARWHIDAFGLRYISARRLTLADMTAMTRLPEVAA